MIDEKKTEEAAIYSSFVNVLPEERFGSPFYSKGFKQGAHWAQKEFKKSLWHDASEEPEKNKLIIEEYLDEYGCNYEIDCLTNSHRTWIEMVKVYGIRKWCYLDDILSQKGGSDV